MDGHYCCRDPLDTVTRMIDTARRLDLGFSALQLERIDDERHLVRFALNEADTLRARNFAARISLLFDLVDSWGWLQGDRATPGHDS